MTDNYDGQEKNGCFPSPVPQFTFKRIFGIAVGMATNIPTHNLKEVCDALDLFN